MALSLVLALVAVVGLCSAAPNHVIKNIDPVIVNYDIDDHARVDSAAARIVGGTATTVDAYPWIVQMEFYTGIWTQACAANILNAIYVLSAAHCTHTYSDPFFRPENRRIRAGATDRNTGGIVRDFMWVLVHPDYYPTGTTTTTTTTTTTEMATTGTEPHTTGTEWWTTPPNWPESMAMTRRRMHNYDADISLIRVNQPLVLGPTIQSIPIASQYYNLPANVPVVHAGWGANTTNGFNSDVLHHVTVNSISHELCRERYSYDAHITENMICTGNLNEGGSGACEGDIGGPLYYGGTLVGVISWSPYCGDSYYPKVNTRVSSYTDWIVSQAN